MNCLLPLLFVIHHIYQYQYYNWRGPLFFVHPLYTEISKMNLNSLQCLDGFIFLYMVTITEKHGESFSVFKYVYFAITGDNNSGSQNPI